MLISDIHRWRYQEYYARNLVTYGLNSRAPAIMDLANKIGAVTLLDYGCGEGSQLRFALLDLQVRSYDPGIEQFAELPLAADIVACLDVLEHCEPETVDAVIEHIKSLANKAIFLTISCQDSGNAKLLPDGTKWHTFVKQHEWWEERLPEFECVSTDRKTYVGILIK